MRILPAGEPWPGLRDQDLLCFDTHAHTFTPCLTTKVLLFSLGRWQRPVMLSVASSQVDQVKVSPCHTLPDCLDCETAWGGHRHSWVIPNESTSLARE